MIVSALDVLGLLSYWDRIRDEYYLDGYAFIISFDIDEELVCNYELYSCSTTRELLVDEVEFKVETERCGRLDARVSGDFRDYGLTIDEAYDKIKKVLDKLEKDLDEETYNIVEEVDGGKRCHW